MDNKKASKLDEGGFMYVRQRLDYYRLPSTFPLESTELLRKLLLLLDEHNK